MGSTRKPSYAPTFGAAHPHVCGEHPFTEISEANQNGSSPRVWGARAATPKTSRQHRLIPTCVGSTLRSLPGRHPISAHPHVCGEHWYTCATVTSESGSSPRVWGALTEKGKAGCCQRLIPTCVGSTVEDAIAPGLLSAHPHVCGEHWGWAWCCCSGPGSSPRVWGARAQGVGHTRTGRLIPTCVGSTFSVCPGLVEGTAHPHVCGEHWPLNFDQSCTAGSSPRVWGARALTRRAGWMLRLIPTCVGSTRGHHPQPAHSPAHPHVCGEHLNRPDLPAALFGSSPRVWGAPTALSVIMCGVRLIPTCVGSTGSGGSESVRVAAHPHVCGEHPKIR